MSGYSALVVVVPEADEALGGLRRRLDPTARDGMAAHVTVVAPFAPPAELEAPVLDRLEAIFAGLDPFEVSFARVGWFDRRVVYLAPEPRAPFVEMTNRVVSSFPAYLPYGGQFDEVVPHCTVGEGGLRARLGLEWAAWRARSSLPVRSRVAAVELMTIGEGSSRWETVRVFALGGGPHPEGDGRSG